MVTVVMRHRIAAFAPLVIGGLVVVACGRATPAGPSTTTAAVPIGAQTNAPPVSVTWTCFTSTGRQSMGIFGAASVDGSCPTRPYSVTVASADAPPSGPPSSLVASVNGTTVTLTWQAAPSSALVPVNSYVIEAGTASGAADVTSFDTGNTATTFTATSVPAGTYYVRVRARNGGGTGPASNEVVVLVGGGSCVAAPGAPTGLVFSVIGSSVTLIWTAPGGGCAPTGYIVEAGSTSGASNLANFNTGSTRTSFSSGSVGAGTYYARVRSANGAGQSGPSNEVVIVAGGGGALTGRWSGTATAQKANRTPRTFAVYVDLQQSGQRLTGTGYNLDTTAPQNVFDLSQSAASGTRLTFAGVLRFTDVGPCPAQVASGSMTVDTAANQMTGSFTGVNADCDTETNTLNLQKQ